MILVTGGTGLVGSHLLAHLASENEKIVAIYRKSSNLEAVKAVFARYKNLPNTYFESISWLEADITNISSLKEIFIGVSKVYHCAALISFHPADYALLRKVNIEGTANIVNLCISNKVKKLCFVSSVAAVGKPLGGGSITENEQWSIENSNYGYAITKYGAETEVWRASQEGLDTVIVNPGVILGAGYWGSGSGKLVSNIAKGFIFYTEGITGYVDVKDVVKIMIALMNSEVKNERYILISENQSFKNVFFKMADELKTKRPWVKGTRLMTSVFWRLNWLWYKLSGKAPFLSRQTASSSHNTYEFSNRKIKNELNYSFIPLNTTIERVCEDYLTGH